MIDTFSKFSKRKILITSSDFILQYSLQHPLLVSNALKQFDLLDHNLNLERPSRLEEQIREGLRWDSSVHMPQIMWNVGTIGKGRLADFHIEDTNGCLLTIGVLMLALGLPGSASVLYGDEIGLPSITNSSLGVLESTSVMKWSEDLNIDPTISFKMLPNNTVIVERFYPRRHRYLLILNLGIKNVTHDLSNTYFGGQTLISSTGRKQGYVKLNQLILSPGEGLLLLLDK